MARIRSIKPEFWLDRKLARSLTRDERLLYIGLWNQADEHGRAQADPRLLKGQIFPFDDDLTDDAIDAMLDTLEGAGVVQLYDVDGDPYLFLPNLGKHQRLEASKVPSRFPDPPELGADQPTQIGANESARDSDESAPDANSSALLYVAGSREHVASPRGADESAPRPDSDRFAEFWDAYPRKKAKPAAVKAWRQATKRADPEEILNGLRRWPFRDLQFAPYPATWLNQDRWADAPDSPTSNGHGHLTRRQIDDLLGEDTWQPPPPPDHIDPDDFEAYRTWVKQVTDEHLAERDQLARAEMTARS